MQSLFPPQQGNSSNQPLYQFKAGKCHLALQPNGKYQVTADKRRGQVTLVRGNDSLLHFKWSASSNGNVEDDRIVMPGEGLFKKVKTGRDTPLDRVYMLKIPGVATPFMYWLQDVDSSKDGDIVREVNNGLNGAGMGNAQWLQRPAATPIPAAASSSAANSNLPTNIGGLDFASLLSAFGANNTMRQGSSAPASTPAPTNSQTAVVSPTPQHGGNALSIDDIRRAMEGRPATNSTASLSDVLNAEEIIRTGILNDPQVQQELLTSLPAEHQSVEALESTLRSAQLQQAAQSFSHALQQTDNFQSIMSNFQIDPSPGMSQLTQGDGVGAFLAALQAANPSVATASDDSSNAPLSEEKKEDSEDRMDEA